MLRDHPLAQKEHLSFEDFAGETILGKGRAYHCFRTNIDQFMLSQGLHVTVPIETPDESLLQQLVALRRPMTSLPCPTAEKTLWCAIWTTTALGITST